MYRRQRRVLFLRASPTASRCISKVVLPPSVDNESSSPAFGNVGTAMRLVNRTAELSIRLSGSFGARHRQRRYAHVHFDFGRHQSGGLDVLRPRSLRTLADVKRDALAFTQVIEPRALACGLMEEILDAVRAAMNPNPLSVRRLIVPVVEAMSASFSVAHVCELQRRCYSYAVSHFAAANRKDR